MGFLIEAIVEFVMDTLVWPVQRRLNRWLRRRLGGKTVWQRYRSRRRRV